MLELIQIESIQRQRGIADLFLEHGLELLRDVLALNLFANLAQFQHRLRAVGDDRYAESEVPSQQSIEWNRLEHQVRRQGIFAAASI